MMDFLIEFVNATQMIAHLPVMQLLFPANVMEFFESLLDIAMFDIVEPETVISWFKLVGLPLYEGGTPKLGVGIMQQV